MYCHAILAVVFTFHYVSILIKTATAKDANVALIYIPLCLYFNINLFIYYVWFNQIYIPLCLYFNAWADHLWSGICKFTFHYVSILIDREYQKLLNEKLFTFHYVSILILLHKHSFPVEEIYIPLCLYFNCYGSI